MVTQTIYMQMLKQFSTADQGRLYGPNEFISLSVIIAMFTTFPFTCMLVRERHFLLLIRDS
jgi:hypothetical protein